MIVADGISQNSPEWDELRLGRPTASCFKKIFTSTGKISGSRTKYLYELAGEKISGNRAKGFQSKHFERGHEREDESARLYTFNTGRAVEKVGFCFFDEEKRFGASPDGLVGSDGGFETKDAEEHVQANRLLNNWQGTEHRVQCMGGMLVTGREWWDLQSYSRGKKPITLRFDRDEKYISLLHEAVLEFCDELDAMVERLQ